MSALFLSVESLFQSTLPREERLSRRNAFKNWCYFNPRSHERSDRVDKLNEQHKNISIHAPTRGATNPIRLVLCSEWISIHAPTRGAT